MSENTDSHFSTPYGCYQLHRYPRRKREQLRAWDAADEYLLNHLNEAGLLQPESRVLILNDSFGAISVALSKWRPTAQSDSYIAHWSTEENLTANDLALESVVRLPSTVELDQQRYDLVLIRVPKTLAFLEYQLRLLKRHLSQQAQVIGFAMAKQIHSSTLDRFSGILGPTRTSLAKKKARLIFTTPDFTQPEKEADFPIWYQLEGQGLQICSHANVFSRERLDIGSRLLIEHIPTDPAYQDIADLGCGSGVLGAVAGLRNPQARLYFVDESYMAVASAEETARASSLTNEMVFRAGDGLRDFARQSLDLVLCNPPFHQQHVVGDFIAWRMFQQARSCLRRGGELIIVGNRHLNYHIKLKRLFGDAKVIASDRKFVIIRAAKR
ncbi:MAG: methyltransferase [Chromatiales bacterium]|nr:methyltransferase [Chromatiales bacterium]